MIQPLSPLPPTIDLETVAVLKQLNKSSRALSLLRGKAATMPNENILISTLTLQEAKDSSAIENIITTHDKLYKAQIFNEYFSSGAEKEVSQYAQALRHGFDLVKKQQVITNNTILAVHKVLENNNAGYRTVAGTRLENEQTGEVVFTPPQSGPDIERYMQELVNFINDNAVSDLDPLIKMALIHHQFETIHPFYDGNGRTGRILNLLYLVLQEQLDMPVMYLSRYLIAQKPLYYKLLQAVRDKQQWEEWIIFMLKGIEVTATQTTNLVDSIRTQMQTCKQRLRTELPKIYSQDLLNNIFTHPYTRIELLMRDLEISRPTATKHLDTLSERGFLKKLKLSNGNYYINEDLFSLLQKGGESSSDERIVTVHKL